MIPDYLTNTVYFAEYTKQQFPKEMARLTEILTEANLNVQLLKGTSDFYCRDYMPVQIADNDFVQFVFRPQAYFKKSDYKYLTHPTLVEFENGLPQPRFSPLILDGGNMVKWHDKVIVTDRVNSDNMYQFSNKGAIIERLKSDLKCDVIVIPEYPNEITGHADGLVRFIDADTVLVNDTHVEPNKAWLRDFVTTLAENGLMHINLPCDCKEGDDSALGLYINYLHVGNVIVVPQFGKKSSDDRALSLLKEVFGSSYTVLPFQASWIARYGGVFNCGTWTVRE